MLTVTRLEAAVILVAAIMFGCVVCDTARHVNVNVEWRQ